MRNVQKISGTRSGRPTRVRRPLRVPEIVFEVAAGAWHPVSIQQDYVGSYREAVFAGEDGKVFVRAAEVRDIQAFARIWDRNLKHQGFVDMATNRDGR
jgi:hypothetical protein